MCSAPVTTGGWTKEKYGYQGTKVSGNTTSRAPLSAASPIAASTFDTVPPDVSRSGAICTAATRTSAFSAMPLSFARAALQSPGVQDERAVAPVQENEVEDVERTDRPDAGKQRRLAVAVEHLQRETAAEDLPAFAHELGQLVAEVLRAREWLVAQLRKAALHAQRHAGPVQQHRGLEAFALQAQRLQD